MEVELVYVASSDLLVKRDFLTLAAAAVGPGFLLYIVCRERALGKMKILVAAYIALYLYLLIGRLILFWQSNHSAHLVDFRYEGNKFFQYEKYGEDGDFFIALPSKDLVQVNAPRGLFCEDFFSLIGQPPVSKYDWRQLAFTFQIDSRDDFEVSESGVINICAKKIFVFRVFE